MCDDDWRQATPPGLRRYAQEYLQVADDALHAHRARLPENQRHHTHVPFPLYFNYLHSIELALKAYLAHTGSDVRHLRQIGHNLEAALDECIERGMREQDDAITDVMLDTVRHANQLYSRKDFEYIRVGMVQLAHIDQVAMAATAILNCMNQIAMHPRGPQDPPQ